MSLLHGMKLSQSLQNPDQLGPFASSARLQEPRSKKQTGGVAEEGSVMARFETPTSLTLMPLQPKADEDNQDIHKEAVGSPRVGTGNLEPILSQGNPLLDEPHRFGLLAKRRLGREGESYHP